MKYTQILLVLVAIFSAFSCTHPCQEQIQNLISQQGCQDIRECYSQLKQTLNFQCLSYLSSQLNQPKLTSPKQNSYDLLNPTKGDLADLNKSSKNVKKLKIEINDFHYDQENENVNLNFSLLGNFENLEKFHLSIKVNSVNQLKGMEFLQTSTKLTKVVITIETPFNMLTITDTMQMIEQFSTLEDLTLDIGTSIWSNQFDLTKLTNLQEFDFSNELKVNLVGLKNTTKLTKFSYSVGERFAQYQPIWEPTFLYDLQYLQNLKELKLEIADKAAINDFGFMSVFQKIPQVKQLELIFPDLTYCANTYPQVQDRGCHKATKLKDLDFLTNIAYLKSLEKLSINLEENDQVKDWSPLEDGIFPLQKLSQLQIYAPYNKRTSLETGITHVKYDFDKEYKGKLDKYSFVI